MISNGICLVFCHWELLLPYTSRTSYLSSFSWIYVKTVLGNTMNCLSCNNFPSLFTHLLSPAFSRPSLTLVSPHCLKLTPYESCSFISPNLCNIWVRSFHWRYSWNESSAPKPLWSPCESVSQLILYVNNYWKSSCYMRIILHVNWWISLGFSCSFFSWRRQHRSDIQ